MDAKQAKPVYIPLHVDAFLSDRRVALMTAEQVGIYFLLLMVAWCEDPPCSLPDDARKLAAWARVKPAKWEAIGGPVMECWDLVDGRYVQSRLAEEYRRSLVRMEINRKKGSKGAEKRWHSPANAQAIAQLSKADSPANAQAMPKQCLSNGIGDWRLEIRDSPESSSPSHARASGIELTPIQEAAANTIHDACQKRLRPLGRAGANWALPMGQSDMLCRSIDAMASGPGAEINGVEVPFSAMVSDFVTLIEASRPVSAQSLAKFLESAWARCQREGCRPGDPHRSGATLKIEREASAMKPEGTAQALLREMQSKAVTP